MGDWKGYDVKRGDFSEAFKQYLRDRGLYFEPSSDGSWVHFEVKNADEAVDRFLKQYENRTRYVYEFPEGTSLKDINLAKRLGLKYLGKAKYRSGAEAYYIEGTLAELKNFAYEAFGDYELHPDYLCKADEFAGVRELKSAGYFEDAKYRKAKDKQMKLTGSKFKDSDQTEIFKEIQSKYPGVKFKNVEFYNSDKSSTFEFDIYGNLPDNLDRFDHTKKVSFERFVEYLLKKHGYTYVHVFSDTRHEEMIVNARARKYFKDSVKDIKDSKFKDSVMDSRVIAEAQKQLDIQQEISYDCYDEETGDWKEPYAKYEKIQDEAQEKAVALCYLIKAYGGVPQISPGLDGLAYEYEGPRGSAMPKAYKVGFNNDSKLIKMCQQEIDRLIDEELSPLYYDEEADEEIDDWSTEEGYKKQMEIDEKVTALCYVIKAYGGTPEIGPGWDGLASNYDGPRRH